MGLDCKSRPAVRYEHPRGRGYDTNIRRVGNNTKTVVMLMTGKATTESEASAILRQSPIGGTHAVH